MLVQWVTNFDVVCDFIHFCLLHFYLKLGADTKQGSEYTFLSHEVHLTFYFKKGNNI